MENKKLIWYGRSRSMLDHRWLIKLLHTTKKDTKRGYSRLEYTIKLPRSADIYQKTHK